MMAVLEMVERPEKDLYHVEHYIDGMFFLYFSILIGHCDAGIVKEFAEIINGPHLTYLCHAEHSTRDE